MEKKLQSNIWKLYLIKGLRSFMLIIPIIVLFFQANGLTVGQIFLLQSLFSFSVIVLEVPTGYFSDKFGRKKSIIIGGIFYPIGFLIYALSSGFWGFMIAEIILGVGMSFISGSDTALMYETLLEMDKVGEYKKHEGRGFSAGLFSEGIASVIGGFLAVMSLRLPLYCDAIVSLLLIPVAITLVETKKHVEKSNESSLRKMIKLMKYSLHDHVEMKWLIVYSAFVGASTLTMVWFIQLYLVATKVPLGLFGVLWAGLLFVAAYFSWHAHSIEKFLGKKVSLIILILLPVAGYALLSSFWFIWSGVFIALFYAARGIHGPIVSDYINGLVSSDVRATILSVKNLVARLIFSLVGPFVGWASDAYSLKVALQLSGLIFLGLGVIALLFLHKHKAL